MIGILTGLLQSVGGGGGSGAAADFGIWRQRRGWRRRWRRWHGCVISAPSASVIATGKNGAALLAQSIGGGGGSGGDITNVDVGASIAIGGVGGLGRRWRRASG